MIAFFKWVDNNEATMLLWLIAFVCLWAAPIIFMLLALPASIVYVSFLSFGVDDELQRQ